MLTSDRLSCHLESDIYATSLPFQFMAEMHLTLWLHVHLVLPDLSLVLYGLFTLMVEVVTSTQVVTRFLFGLVDYIVR